MRFVGVSMATVTVTLADRFPEATVIRVSPFVCAVTTP